MEDVIMAKLGLENATASALFHCQQICEKAMKACLCLVGIFVAEEHNTVLLFANHVLPLTTEPQKEQLVALMPDVQGIEWFYIPSRYGVDRYGRVWVREYSVDTAKATLDTSKKWLELCFLFVEHKTQIPFPRKRVELLSLLRKEYAEVVRE
ncbi:HEPN domain-containing protein [Candidatus Poribacteria bacterium]|nr:HEPN domain-containing protein [Candidatus Poribacteria bacterium]